MPSLKTAIGNYGLTKPLKEGRVNLGRLNLEQVEVNPITLLVTAVRSLMHGVVTADQLGWVLLSCGVLIAVFGMLTMRRYRRT